MRARILPISSVAPRQATTTVDPALLKALARAFRWKRMLDDGRYAFLSGIAWAEKIDRTYAGDILRLTLLAPEIVETILDGRQAQGLTTATRMDGVPVEWEPQRQ
jgi:hypothetical protein